MAPVALFSRAFGTRDALALARILTALVVGLNATVAALVVRPRGRGAMMIAGLGLACFPLAVAADHSLMLEPFLVCFCLLGVLAMFDAGRLAGSRRLLLAGALFGFAGAIKLWAIFPVLAALGCCLVVRRARPFFAGLVAGFCIPTVPFLLLAPGTMIHDVLISQLGRGTSGRGGLSIGQRLVMIFGIGQLQDVVARTRIAEWIALVVVAVVIAAFVAAGRRASVLEWFLLTSTLCVCAGMFLAREFYDHYAYFATAFVVLLVASSIGRIGEAARAHGPRLKGYPGRAVVVGFSLVLPAALILGALALIPHDAAVARSYLASSDDPASLVRSAVPKGACVVFDEAIIVLDADRFSSSRPGCPKVEDPFGMWLTDNNRTPPPANPPFPVAFSAKWQSWIEQADYVVLSVPGSNYIPWTPGMSTWFAQNYVLVASRPHTYIFRNVAAPTG
jgi:hypothetical protein